MGLGDRQHSGGGRMGAAQKRSASRGSLPSLPSQVRQSVSRCRWYENIKKKKIPPKKTPKMGRDACCGCEDELGLWGAMGCTASCG